MFGMEPSLKIRKNTIRSALIFLVMTQTVQAYELICSNKSVSTNDQFRTTSQFSNTDFTIEELMELFSTGSQSARAIPTRVCMLPNDHSATRKLFSDMGIDPASSLSDKPSQANQIKNIKLVQSESEMIACVKGSAPSIGYVERLPSAHQQIACFE